MVKSQTELKQEVARHRKESDELRSEVSSVKTSKDLAIAARERLRDEAEMKAVKLEVRDSFLQAIGCNEAKSAFVVHYNGKIVLNRQKGIKLVDRRVL